MDKQKLIEYLPDFMRDFREMSAILDVAQQPEINALWDEKDLFLVDQFILTATDRGIRRYEKLLDLSPKADETLEERRFAVLTRYVEQIPFTESQLREQLDTICGKNRYSLEINSQNCIINILVELTSRHNYQTAEDFIRRVCPANMLINISLRYNQWKDYANKKWGELSNKTWDNLRNEVL